MRLNLLQRFVVIIGILVIPLLVYSVFHYQKMIDDEIAHQYHNTMILSRRIASEMDHLVGEARSLLRGLAVHPSVMSLDSYGCDKIAHLLLSNYPEYLNILGARMDGQNFCSGITDPVFRSLNYNDKEWFQEGSKGKPYTGNVHISKYFRKPAVMITMPVFKEHNQIAVLGAALNLETVSRRLEESFRGSDIEIIVLDRVGEVILNTKNPGKTVGIDLMKEEGTFRTKGPDGIERLYGFSTSSNGWKVITGIPVGSLESHIMLLRREYLYVLIALAVIGVVISIGLTIRPRKGIAQLMRAISEIERENYSYRISLSGRDELGRLAQAFNKFSERLEILHKNLKESESFYRSLIENSSDMVIMTDRTGGILYGSPSIQLLGYSLDEIKGRSIFEFLDPVYAPEVKRKIDEAIANPETVQTATIRAFHRDGLLRLLNAKGRYLKDRDYLLINCMDITENLKKDVLLNDILGSIGEGFLILDREFRVVSANKAYLERLRMELSEIKGRYCWEISHRQKEPCYNLGEVCPARETLRTGEPSLAVHTHYSKNYEPLYVEVRSYPLKDLSGRITGIIETVSDITEQKMLEAQLRQAQRLESIGQLAGGVAHDFNNILTAISGYGSLLDMKLPPESPLREYVAEIMKAVERASNLTKGLLAFSRKQPGEPRPVDLNEIVRTITKLLSKLIREDIKLEINLSHEDLIVMADPGHIEQVLMNLATNARDAMPEGGVLTIKTEKVYIDERFRDIHGYGKPGEYAMLSVSDTGIGMDENIKARIFEPFFTTKEEGKGTGLGLSIVYGLVKQYDGYINVYSEPGGGSTFKIYLPIYRTEEKAESQQKKIVFTKGLGEMVLLVDDDHEVRESIRHVLDFAGYRVIEASDGVEALEIFKGKMDEIDLVITDLIMPRKNGKVLYDEIKVLKPSQKVVFISGHTADSLYKQYLPEDGVIIFKPVLPSEFLRQIREQFDEGT